MSYKLLLSRLGYRLFDAGLCVQCLGVLVVRDVTKVVRRWSESRLTEAALQLEELEKRA